jgi:hypothetical protein
LSLLLNRLGPQTSEVPNPEHTLVGRRWI